MKRDELYYDFDRDAWIETPGIHAHWSDRDLLPPTHPPAPGKWLRPPRRFRMFLLLWPLMLLTQVLMLLALVWKAFVLVPVAAAVMGIFQLLNAYRSPPSAVDRRLLENPDDLDVCLVEVTINRNGRTVGVDRGAAWFGEGRLLFSGHATSFAIGGEDVLPRSQWHRLQENRTHILPLRDAGSRTALVFEPLHLRSVPDERQQRFLERLHAFRKRPPQSRGPRQWPPFKA